MTRRRIVIPFWWVFGAVAAFVIVALVLASLALARVANQADDTCQLAVANRATLQRLIDVPRSAPGGPDAYFARQRVFYASIGFSPAQTQLVLDAAAAERRRLISQLGEPPAC